MTANGNFFGPTKVKVVEPFPPALSRDNCNSWSTAIQALNLVRVIPFIFHTLHTEECVRKHSPWMFYLMLAHRIGLCILLNRTQKSPLPKLSISFLLQRLTAKIICHLKILSQPNNQLIVHYHLS